MINYLYCPECEVMFHAENGHECIPNYAPKKEPDDITELRNRVAKANELSYAVDNRGNHRLGAFLTGILEEYDRVVAELARWKTGDWCDICNRPQWVAVDGSHECDNIQELQLYIDVLERQNATMKNNIEDLKWKYEEMQKNFSFWYNAVNDIATALGWKPGQTYDVDSMLKKIEELQK